MSSKQIYPFYYLLLSAVIPLGCSLLFRLSQFGQNPFANLPLAVIVFFGMLFISPLMALSKRLEDRTKLYTLGLALLISLLLSFILPQFTFGKSLYVLASLVAVAGSELLLRFTRQAELLAAMLVYIVCTLLANYTFDSFLPLPFYGLINVGTLFFGITFTQRDRVHRYGRKYAYLMIGVAAIANVLTALSLGTPLRYVVVGFAAILISEAADTEVYQRFIKRGWWTRVATSNAVSIPLDTVIFTVFAFYGEAWATGAWMTEVIITDIVVKLIVGFIAALGVTKLRSQPRLQTV